MPCSFLETYGRCFWPPKSAYHDGVYIYISDIYIYVVFGEVVTGASALVNRSVTHVAGFFGEVFSARWFWCVWK